MPFVTRNITSFPNSLTTLEYYYKKVKYYIFSKNHLFSMFIGFFGDHSVFVT